MDLIAGVWGDTKEVWINRSLLDPAKSYQVLDTGYARTPPPFSWGEHSGSGLSQLALAILLEFTDADNAIRLYTSFKWENLSTLIYGENFIINVDVKQWVENTYIKSGGG